MSIEYGHKLRQIRQHEGLTQKAMSDLTGITISAIKGYETQGVKVGISIIERVLNVEIFQKYTMWLMTDKTNEGAGQISPTLSPDGADSTPSDHLEQKTG
ncbi:helix-turn-helix transcriptional regulator [Morganella morganii]|uniref:helix-turn-helix domain-containing protein n=1 Tax=Morganella morganii TaxID=582 RepID=UPI0016516409|nr:helix-turn-helix transcriptional regulator [Morganella morganii]MBC6659853.1 helix-turn-helix transcriptional regulator [Morganella morganii]